MTLLAAGAAVLAAQEAQINARDAFFSAADMVAVNKQGQAPAKTSRPAKTQPVGTKSDPGKASRPKPELAKSQPVQLPPTAATAEAHFRLASESQPEAVRPMGLRYSILKKTASGLMETPADSEFRAGDSIRLSVMGNQKGYLYVIARGSSGVWTPLFPHPESAQQTNEIVPGRIYQVPGGEGEYFTFDEQAGEEKLFVVLSRKPVEDIEEIIGGITGSKAGVPAAPAARPQRPPMEQASLKLDDSWVDRLRAQVASRDLVFTKVAPGAGEAAQTQAPAAAAEQAVYVVNTAGTSSTGDGGRIVVDLVLRHK